ncbi:MAG: serine/threonine protein kinase [Planctomycetaceae bacterium]
MANFLKNLFDRKKVERVDIARRFELLARVGQGSMSKVWRARDSMTGRMLAIKVLDKVKTERFESRFVGLKKPTEGEIAVGLLHPNIVKTHEFGTTTNDEQYLMMDFVDGLSLSYLVDTQNDQMKENCLNYIIQLGEAIDYLHKQNWIHRDLCPRNVMVDSDNTVKLIDFGLVVPNTPDFQKPGNRTGTANYMAPELIKRQRTDQRIDVFSFSVTAYEMYSKRLPWDVPDQETLDTVIQHINKPPKPLAGFAPHIDPRVADILMKGLHQNPNDRWQSMAEMLIPLRKVHEELEAKKALERKMRAASTKAKSRASDPAKGIAATAAQAQKLADDDAFFEQILLGDAPVRSDKPKSKPTPTPAATPAKPAPPKVSREPADTATKLRPAGKTAASATSVTKKSSGKPVAKPKVIADEFDGIEIESDGEGIEIEFDGDDIEIESEGNMPLEAPAISSRSGSPLAERLNEARSDSLKTDTAVADDDDDEPVLRLPDDD